MGGWWGEKGITSLFVVPFPQVLGEDRLNACKQEKVKVQIK